MLAEQKGRIDVNLHRFEAAGLAHYSYLISSAGSAAVVDPQRDVDVYLSYAASQGLKIGHVLETHIHADFASGALELAEQCGAQLWLSGHDAGQDFQYRFPHCDFYDSQELLIGEGRVRALHTPGHTPEHLSFLIYETVQSNHPQA